jgi:phage major head subunit gpT-like protein
MVGMGVAVVKPEGSPVQYGDMQQGFIRRTNNVVLALGMQVSMEAIEDCLYDVIFNKTRELSRSMYLAKQILAANIFNNGYSSSATYLDGQPLFSTAHLRKGGGTYANRLAAGIDLSELALETIYTNTMANRDERGNLSPLMTQTLVVPPSLKHQALRLTKSDRQAETANNAINAIVTNGTVKNVVENPFLTDSDAFFMTTDIPGAMGLIYQERKALNFDQDKDADTFNAKFLASERYNFDVVDVRCVYGSPGL